MAFYTRSMDYATEAGTFTIMVGNSSDNKHLKTTQLTLTKTLTFKP
ncbi:MAG: hypothetical protein R2795_22695 [Saprospiraceae bacterium]